MGGFAGRRVVSPRLVGRAAELDALVAAIATPPAVAVLAGEAGVGKTRLVAELAARAEQRFLWGGCRLIREPFPLGPVLEALCGLGEELAPTGMSPVVGALRPLLPELADRLPPAPGPLADRAAERHRVFRALAQVLAAVGPAVLVLEDLHWADEQTVDFLSYLLGDPPPKLTLVLTFRDEDVDPDLPALAARPPAPVGVTRVALAPLGLPETGGLAAAIMGADRVPDEFAAQLWRRTSGLPFAVEELLALLLARGDLPERGANPSGQMLAGLDVPSGIRDQARLRVSRLSDLARSVVRAAAVLQEPVPAEVVTRTCRMPVRQARPGLVEALSSGFLTEHAGRVGFRHLLAAQAVYEDLPGPARTELHGRAAAALARLDPAPLGQVAYHLRRAGRLREWAVAAERAADQAVALGHDGEAARLLEEVLREAQLDPARRGSLAVKLAHATAETLPGADPIDLLTEVLDQDLPQELRGELRFRLMLLRERSGADPHELRRMLAAAVPDLDSRPDLQAWAMMGLGCPTVAGVPLAEHRDWLRRALAVLPAVRDPGFEAFLLGKVAMVLAGIGDRSWRRLVDRMVAQTGGRPRQRREVNAYRSVGMEAGYLGHHRRAAVLLTAARAGAADCESPRLVLSVRASLALLDYCRGAWRGLPEAVAALGDELAEDTRRHLDVDLVAGCLALARGDLDQAEIGLTDLVRRLEHAGGYDALPVPAGALIRLQLARADPDTAAGVADRLLAVVASNGIWAPVARALPWVSQALVAAGRPAEATALVDRYARQLRGLDVPIGSASVRQARGVLAAADPVAAPAAVADHFLAAATAYQRLPGPYEAAQAREQAARWLFTAGDERAGETLRSALAGYQRLGAGWDAARAAQVARRHRLALPGRHRGGRRGYGAELSPREREVADLAATGRTNNEIAAALFLSPHTVKKHLSEAMRKLGLRSRTALPTP